MRQRWISRLAVGAAAGFLTLTTATAAWAETTPVPINSGNVPTTAADFETHDCDDILDFFTAVEDKAPSIKAGIIDHPYPVDGWHFVLGQDSGDDFVSLSLNFTTPDGPVTVTIPGESEDPGWFGVLGSAGGKDDKHAYLLTEAGWTLTGGTAQVTGTVTSDKPHFQLSHTCAGTPETSTPTPGTGTPTPENTPTPGVSGSSAPGTSTSTSPSPSGGLPVTGVAWGATALTAVGLIAAGVALMAVRRRRELTEENPTEL